MGRPDLFSHAARVGEHGALKTMEKRILGRTGMEVTALGFGAAEIGYESVPFDRVERILNGALDQGLNVIDTAECYPGSEEMIGRALERRRSSYFLFTKCGHASGLPLPDWDPKMLELQIDRSLHRLRTDCVDLVQLHSCGRDRIEKGDVVAVLQRAQAAGKTRFIGYSGDSLDAVSAIRTGAFDTLQASLSIADQEAIDLTLPLARERSMGIIAKRPIANAAWKTGAKPSNPYHHEYWRRLNELRYDFLAGELDAAVSIALRFTLSISDVATAIVGTTRLERWASNARLLEQGPLDPASIESIRRRWRETAGPEWKGEI